MTTILRLFPLFLLVCLIDLAFFYAIVDPIHDKVGGNVQWPILSFWSITIILFVWFIVNAFVSFHKIAPIFRKYSIMGFQLIYVSKIVGIILLILASIIVLLISFLIPINTIILSYIGLVTSLGMVVILPYGIMFNKHNYQIEDIDIPIENLHRDLEGLRIVHISDIHIGTGYEKSGILKGINLINELKPDIIFFTGDLVNNRSNEFIPYVELFRLLKSKLGIFSVLGNHDYGDYVVWKSTDAKQRNLQQLISLQEEIGWKVLINENQLTRVGDAQVAIIGVENYSAKMRFPKYGDLNAATQSIQDAHLKLLLSHDPSHWRYEILPHFQDIDITFSGHTHGMQFGIKLGRWLWSPVQYVYKEWAGLYQQGYQYLYVNRGFGVLGYPGRIGMLPEITKITLTRNDA